MCYRCEVCKKSTEPTQPRFTHNLYRKVSARIGHIRGLNSYGNWVMKQVDEPDRLEIAREIWVCQECFLELKRGTPISILYRTKGKLPIPVYRRAPTLYGDKDNPTICDPDNVLGRRGVKAQAHNCDVCGKDAKGGQVTADTILCVEHCNKASSK